MVSDELQQQCHHQFHYWGLCMLAGQKLSIVNKTTNVFHKLKDIKVKFTSSQTHWGSLPTLKIKQVICIPKRFKFMIKTTYYQITKVTNVT